MCQRRKISCLLIRSWHVCRRPISCMSRESAIILPGTVFFGTMNLYHGRICSIARIFITMCRMGSVRSAIPMRKVSRIVCILQNTMSMSTESASIARRMNEMISTVYMPEISGQSISFLDMEEVQGFVRLMWKILEERILGISGLDISISIWHLRSSMYIIREVWSRSMRTKLENMGLSMDISTSS